jgi:hypothetical protein
MSENNEPFYSCSVSVDPEQILTRNFDIKENPEIALAVFQEKQRELEAAKRGAKPKTDRFLTECDKKIRLLQTGIDQIEANLPRQRISASYPRKDKRQWKALRRKLTRIERKRINHLRS